MGGGISGRSRLWLVDGHSMPVLPFAGVDMPLEVELVKGNLSGSVLACVIVHGTSVMAFLPGYRMRFLTLRFQGRHADM